MTDTLPPVVAAPAAASLPAAEPTKEPSAVDPSLFTGLFQLEKQQGEEAEGQPSEHQPEEVIEYTDFAMPEGIQADAELLEEFKNLAIGYKLPQAEAQKFVDLGVKLTQKAHESYVRAWEDMQASWIQSASKHPEYGGKNFAKNMALARLALDKDKMVERFGMELVPQELKQLLAPRTDDNPMGTGFGNNPYIIGHFYRLGKLLADDNVVIGQPSSSSNQALSTEDYYKKLFKAGS